MSESLAKTELPCIDCEVFQKTKNLANRALICETARTCGNCLMIKKLEAFQKQLQGIINSIDNCGLKISRTKSPFHRDDWLENLIVDIKQKLEKVYANLGCGLIE